MKMCQKCGHQMDDNEVFCSECGSKWEAAGEAAAPAGGFCPNCGERVEKLGGFCPNCGAGLGRQEDSVFQATGEMTAEDFNSRKKKMTPRTIGILAVAVIAVVAIIFVALFLSRGGSPAKRFVSYQKEMFLEKGIDVLSKTGDAINSNVTFSTDMSLTAKTSDRDVDRLLNGTELNLKVDSTKDSVLINGDLVLAGSPLLSGILTYEKGMMGFSLPELDPHYYVFDLLALAEKSGAPDEALKLLEANEVKELPVKDMAKVVKTYGDLLLNMANDENVTKAESGRIRLSLLRTNLDGELYVFEPSEADLEELLLKLADTMEKDKNLQSLAAELQPTVDALEAAGSIDLDGMMLEEYIQDGVDYLRRNASSMARNAIRNGGIRWILGVSDGEICLQKLELGDDEVALVYEEDGDHSAFYVESYGSVDFKVETTCTQGKDGYSGMISLGDDVYEQVCVTFEKVQPKTKSILGLPYGVYSLQQESVRLTVEIGKSDKGGTDHVLRLEDVNIGYSKADELELTLHTSDKKATTTKPKEDPVDITQDILTGRVDELFEDMGRQLQEIMGSVAMSMSGLR